MIKLIPAEGYKYKSLNWQKTVPDGKKQLGVAKMVLLEYYELKWLKLIQEGKQQRV